MTEIFIKLLNMSIAASWLVLCVIALRLVFKKAPRWTMCVLWAMVAIRLLCPFSIESALSLVPSAETVPETIVHSESPEIHTGIEYFNSTVNPIISEGLAPIPESRVNPMEIIGAAASVIWIAGMAAMAVYATVSYVKIRKRAGEALEEEKGVWICDRVDTPFILGVFRPRIILPSDLPEGDREYVLAHEKAHIKRLDHIWKPLGFLLLTVYWFNPLLWVAYILLCRDIEGACDEKVIKSFGEEAKAPYANALINCSASKKLITACPLAFGETGVKSRIRSVLSYKKPAFWIIIVSLIACVGAGIFFLTDPIDTDAPKQESYSELSGLTLEIKKIETSYPDPYIIVEWENKTGKDIVYGEDFYIFFDEDGVWENMRMEDNYVWNSVAHYLSSGQRVEKRYYLNGIIMTDTGKYRFETSSFIEGAPEKKYKATVVFELKEGIAPIGVHTLDPAEIVYDAPMFSFVQTPENAPEYMLVNGMELLESEDVITSLGVLEERNINEIGFEDLFYKELSDLGWSKDFSAKKMMEENRRLWELDSNGEDYYVLLLQEDGRYFLGVGHIMEGVRRVRWLYRMTEIGSDSGNEVTQLADNGSIYYYDTSYGESETVEIARFYRMTDVEMSKLSNLLKKESWVCDALVDRLGFEFDGKLLCEGEWLYFGYEQSVFYYDEYFCEDADDAAELLKELSKKSELYAPVSKSDEDSAVEDGQIIGPQVESDVKIYVCHDSPERVFSPNVTLSEPEGTFHFSFSAFSSEYIAGRYERTDSELILRTDGNSPNEYVFALGEGDTLVFNAEKSAKIPSYRYGEGKAAECPVPDGAVFSRSDDYRMSQLPVIDTIDHDLNGDGYPENITLTHGPTSGVNSLRIHVTDVKNEKEYSEWWSCDFESASLSRDGDRLAVVFERRLGNVGSLWTFEKVCTYVSIEKNELVFETMDSSTSSVFLKYYDFEKNKISVSQSEINAVCEKMYEMYGRTDPHTGFDYYCVVDCAFDVDGVKYYLIYWKWLVEDENGEYHHASTIDTFVMSEDLSDLHGAYVEDDGTLHIYYNENLS